MWRMIYLKDCCTLTNTGQRRLFQQPSMTGQTPQQKRQQAIGEKEIAKAVEVLKKYKDGKTNLEKTIVENEKWYRLRHWDVFKGTNNNGKREPGDERPEPASGLAVQQLGQ